MVQGALFARRRHERIRSARWLAFNLRGCGRSATQQCLVVFDSPEALLRERGLLSESELEGERESERESEIESKKEKGRVRESRR